jgi:hypothetical protein
MLFVFFDRSSRESRDGLAWGCWAASEFDRVLILSFRPAARKRRAFSCSAGMGIPLSTSRKSARQPPIHQGVAAIWLRAILGDWYRVVPIGEVPQTANER